MMPHRTRGQVLVNTGMLWLTTSTAAVALWPIYETPALVVAVVVALSVGTAIALVGARWRWPGWLVLIVAVLAFLVVGVPAAVPSQARLGVFPTLDGLIALVSGVALGWKQLVTISLPVGSYEALLVPVLVLVLTSTIVGLSIATRSRRAELAVVAPAFVYLVALALGPDEPTRAVIVPVALLVEILLWLAWMRWRRRRAAVELLTAAGTGTETIDARVTGSRTALAAVLILALSSGAAVAVAGAVPPEEQRTVVRTTVVQPFDPRDHVSPLSTFRSYWKAPTADTVLFSVAGVTDGEFVRLATMDTYDGVVFSVGTSAVSSESGSFTRVPSRIDQSGAVGTRQSVAVDVQNYSDVWLPTVGAVESVSFEATTASELRDQFFYNATTGSAAVIGGLTSGDAYTLEAVVPENVARADLRGLDPGSAVVPAASSVPDEVTSTLDRYIEGVEGSGARLVAMLEGLSTEGYISHGGQSEPPSRSGHAADRIAELLSAPRMIGDAEQYAVTAALMARELGYPSRVVMGFVPDGGQIRGSNVAVWIEVNTAQRGWVMIDPTPPFREIPDELPQENAQVSRPPTIVPPPIVESENFDRQTTPDTERELPPDLDPLVQVLLVVLRALGWTALGVALILSPFLVIVAAKLRRRRLRRRAPTVAGRIQGGWQEFEDAVVDRGLSPSASATRSEVAHIAGGVQALVLAAVADRATFSPDEPTPSEADSVWRAVEELRASLDSGRTTWQRITAYISLRSLGGYSVRKLFTR